MNNILHVRSVPDSLYQRIQNLAAAKKRSLTAQVITLLEQAVDAEEKRLGQAVLLDSIQRRRFAAPANTPDSIDLLREDRQR
jgi:plasmid stability protein